VNAGDPTGGSDNDLTIERSAVEAESGHSLIFRDGDRILTYYEAFDELTPEMAEGLQGLPAEEQVLTGGDMEAYIFESGTYETVELTCDRIVTRYSDGRTRWTDYELREQAFPTADHGTLSFEDWLSAQLEAGMLTAVDVLQFVGYADEDADEATVITERLIVD
jgi:hypothetical protein